MSHNTRTPTCPVPSTPAPTSDLMFSLKVLDPCSDTRRPLTAPESAQGEYRVRKQDSKPYTAHATFRGGEGWRMRREDAVKATAVVIDVDLMDSPAVQAHLGHAGDALATKQVLKSMEGAEVGALMEKLGILENVLAATRSLGLPLVNRILYTGHGLQLIHWLPESMGAVVGDGWNLARMDRIWRAAFGKHGVLRTAHMWWCDPASMDIGTRIGPVPGYEHRSAPNKVVSTLAGQDDVPESEWVALFTELEETVPALPVRARLTCQPTDGAAQTSTGSGYARIAYNRASHGELGEDRSACPVCESSSSLRIHDERATCHGCETHFIFGAVAAPAPVSKNITVELNEKGHAVWPETLPAKLLLSTRTGTGKTYLMESAVTKWLAADPLNKVLALAPTTALAKGMADRLGLVWGSAAADVSLETERGIACCLASLKRKSKGASFSLGGERDLSHVLLIVDEVEASLSQLVSMFGAKKGRDLSVTLRSIIGGAGSLILADAHAGAATQSLLEQAGVADEVTEFTSVKHDYTFEYINGDADATLSSHSRARAAIISSVCAGEKLAVFCASRNAALDLATVAETLVSGNINWRNRTPVIKVVVGARDASETPDFSQEALTADLLIYTTAMGSGVSYDVKDHYDRVEVLLGAGGHVDVRTVEQAVHRIRHPKTSRIRISGEVRQAPGRVATDDGFILSPLGSADYWLERAERMWLAGEQRVLGLCGEALVLDDMREFDGALKALEVLQAAALGESYRAGIGGVLTALDQDHTVVLCEDHIVNNTAVIVNRASKAVREARELELCERTAAAAVIEDEAIFTSLRDRGAEATVSEVDRVRATTAAKLYGPLYIEANEEVRAELVSDMEKGGEERVKTVAMAVLLNGDEADKLRAASILAWRRQGATAVTTGKLGARAELLAKLLAYLSEGEMGEENITDDHATDYLTDVGAELLDEAGVTVRTNDSGDILSPRRALATILRFGGLKFRTRHVRVDGRKVRHYTLDLDVVAHMARLASHQLTTWRAATRHYEPNPMTSPLKPILKARATRAALLGTPERAVGANFLHGTCPAAIDKSAVA